MHSYKDMLDMRKKILFFIAFSIFLSAPLLGLAYEPVLVLGGAGYETKYSETAKGYYSRLIGVPMKFRFNLEESADLDVYLRIPDVPDADKNVTASLRYKDESGEFKKLDLIKPATEWEYYRDEFSGNGYYLGPEAHVKVASGTQTILISSEPDNEKPFVLIVGKNEDESLGSKYRTMIELGKIKNIVYSEFPLTAYYNYYGVLLLVPSILIFGLLIFWGIKTYLRIKKEDDAELKDNSEESDPVSE